MREPNMTKSSLMSPIQILIYHQNAAHITFYLAKIKTKQVNQNKLKKAYDWIINVHFDSPVKHVKAKKESRRIYFAWDK